MAKIRKATQKDILKILKLGYELNIYLDSLKKIKNAKGKYYLRINRLDLNEKAIIHLLLSKFLHDNQKSFSLNKLKKIYSEFCNTLLLKEGKFDDKIKRLKELDFVKQNNKTLILKVSKGEVISIRKLILRDLYINHFSKKKNIERAQANVIHLIAEEDQQAFGYLLGWYIHFGRYGTGEIEELIVSQGTRDKGIGIMLVKKFLKTCEKKNVNLVTVTTPKENKRAIKFYKRCGFNQSKQTYLYWTPYKW